MTDDQVLRQHLKTLLYSKNAHCTMEDALKDFPKDYINKKADGVPYTAYRLFEHIRICQWDIWQFTVNPHHVSPDFPVGYWPPENVVATWQEWEESIRLFWHDLEAMAKLLDDPSVNLYQDLPHAPGYTILREILLLADHNAYHLGGLVSLRRSLNIWP